MSRKVAIVADSTSGLTDDLLKQYHIFPSYLMIIFEHDSYKEFKELSPERFVELSNAQKELPSTSQPSIGETVENYQNILKEGYDEIIHLTISSTLSGSYASAVSAAEMVDASKIHLFDTKTVAYPQGALTIEAATMANDGKSAEEILARLAELQSQIALVGAIYDMTNLRKGGRITPIAASLGNMLQIKPVIMIMPDGSLQPIAKVRTFKKALDALIEQVKEANLDESKDQICVLHLENPEAAAQLKEKILNIYPTIDIVEVPISLVVAIHVGPGIAAIGWIRR
ncbi:MAG: DegV family protein [Turicibacter sp.]|nr:DegV family protein [Turicibacter sp.]